MYFCFLFIIFLHIYTSHIHMYTYYFFNLINLFFNSVITLYVLMYFVLSLAETRIMLSSF